MTLKTEIVNGQGGRSTTAFVNQNHALRTESSVPEIQRPGTVNRARLFNGFVTNAAGVSNMNVDGSVTPVEFTLQASTDYDLYVTGIDILIASNSIANNKFGDLPALSNGWDLFVIEQGMQTDIVTAATTTGELTVRSTEPPLDLANWNPSNDNARSIRINIKASFAFDTYQGVRIGRGGKDRLVALVSDDLTGLSELTVRAIGTRLYPWER
jgi:hypothetical protein